jgi:hypothetical protein
VPGILARGGQQAGALLRVRLPPITLKHHNRRMSLTYAVIGSSEADVKAALRQLCDLFEQERWLGRVAPPLPTASTPNPA